MCILCVLQKWSRRVATMLPWLVIPLVMLWALSQLLPPAFRFEITSPRLACVFVLLITLFWYEVFMPQLSAWRAKRNARLREQRRSEAIELQKLRKTATRRCRNCLTPYRDQNPCGGKFMCSYCGHISKRPVLDLPASEGMELTNSGILKDLVGKGGKILNGNLCSDNGWMCGQEWFENENWSGGSFSGNSSHWGKIMGGGFGSDNPCLAEKSYSRVIILICKGFMAMFFGIMWPWRKIFRGSSEDGTSADAEHRAMLAKRGENGANCQESKGEKARRKAEEKKQARLEKELLEEEERKQREEVARLVEERRKQRDEMLEFEKDHGKESPATREKDNKKVVDKKCQERKKEKDRGSSKINSDMEELEKKIGKENEQNKKAEGDRREHHRIGAESAKGHTTDMGHGSKIATVNSHNKGNVGNRYLDRIEGTFLSSSRALTGGGFFGKGATTSALRDSKSNGSVDHVHIPVNRPEFLQQEHTSWRSHINGEHKNINCPVLTDPQPCTAPKKSWQQLFTRSTVIAPPNSNVISRPNGKSQAEVKSSPFPGHLPSTQVYNNPINFGLPSPFNFSSIPYGTANTSTALPLPSEPLFARIGGTTCEIFPEESDIFEDPCYVPDPVSLLGPVSESLDKFQLDLGFVTDGLDNQHALNTMPASSEAKRISPIESQMSRLRVPDERHTTFPFAATPKSQDMFNLPTNYSNISNERGTWQMWSSNPLGQDGMGLVGSPASWRLPPELRRSNEEEITHPVPQKTMVSLFKKDDQVFPGTYTQKPFLGDCQNGGTYNSSVPNDDQWLPNILFEPVSSSESQFFRMSEENIQNEMIYESPRRSANNHPFELSSENCWIKKDWNGQSAGEDIGNSLMARPRVDSVYSTPQMYSHFGHTTIEEGKKQQEKGKKK